MTAPAGQGIGGDAATPAPQARLHLLVGGRVQGVGFRRSVQRAAGALGVGGWVRNRSDGRVEVAASGTRDALAEFRAAVLRGPAHAAVTEIEDLPPASGDDSRPFAILPTID